jgi:hypothetical protein
MMMVIKKPEELWITNIDMKQDHTVGDLRITVRRGQSINLLSKKKNGLPRYPTCAKKEDIEKSRKEGSLFRMKDIIKVREVAPIVFNHRIDVIGTEQTGPVDRSSLRVNRPQIEVEDPDYPDLEFDEEVDDRAQEAYAEENADADFADRRPLLAVDPKFKKPTVDDE